MSKAEVGTSKVKRTKMSNVTSDVSGKRLAPEERREQILRATLEIIAEGGFGFTMREVAQKLNVTHSLVFRYFQSKEDLLDAVYESVFAGRFTPEQRRLIARTDTDILRKWVEFYQSYVEQIYDRHWTRIFITSAMQNQLISRRYLDGVVEPVVQHLSADTLNYALGDKRASEEENLLSQELAWSLHSSFFYTGIRRWVYEIPTPVDISSFIQPKVIAHFESAKIVLKSAHRK